MADDYAAVQAKHAPIVGVRGSELGKQLQGSNRVFFEGRENTPFENSFQDTTRATKDK